MKINQFNQTGSWRLRQVLDDHLDDLDNAVTSLKSSRNRREFNRDNFDYALKESERAITRLAKFYKKHK